MTECQSAASWTVDEQITSLRTAAARCRRLAKATDDEGLPEALSAMADDYEARIQELLARVPAGQDKINELSPSRH
jgi:hypothetical protein